MCQVQCLSRCLAFSFVHRTTSSSGPVRAFRIVGYAMSDSFETQYDALGLSANANPTPCILFRHKCMRAKPHTFHAQAMCCKFLHLCYILTSTLSVRFVIGCLRSFPCFRCHECVGHSTASWPQSKTIPRWENIKIVISAHILHSEFV